MQKRNTLADVAICRNRLQGWGEGGGDGDAAEKEMRRNKDEWIRHSTQEKNREGGNEERMERTFLHNSCGEGEEERK